MDRVEDNVPESLKCPICFELPKGNVYQCSSGHVICEQCYTPLRECPMCRSPFGPNAIRNRVMEEMLDELRIDCPYKASGCHERLARQNIRSHVASCPYNSSRSTMINLCSLIGYNGCTFQVTAGNSSNVIHHFKQAHDFTVDNSSSLQFEICNFFAVVNKASAVKLDNFGRPGVTSWKPVILNLKDGSAILILTMVNPEDKSVSWIPINIQGATSIQVEFQVKSGAGVALDPLSLKWSISPFDILQVGEFLPSRCPFRIPASLLTKKCTKEGSLFVQCKVKQDFAEKDNFYGDPTICLTPEMANLSLGGNTPFAPPPAFNTPLAPLPSYNAPVSPHQQSPLPPIHHASGNMNGNAGIGFGWTQQSLQKPYPTQAYGNVSPQNFQQPPYSATTIITTAPITPMAPAPYYCAAPTPTNKDHHKQSKKDKKQHHQKDQLAGLGQYCSSCQAPFEKFLYQCLQCANFRVCKKCTKKTDHRHLFAVVRNPMQFNKLMVRGAAQAVIPIEITPQQWWDVYADEATRIAVSNRLTQVERKCANPDCREDRISFVCLECPTNVPICSSCEKKGYHVEHILAVTDGDKDKKNHNNVTRKFLLYQQDQRQMRPFI